jgi:ABC-2 type transport system ATP-binding protein
MSVTDAPGPPAISVSGLHKTFRIPQESTHTLKERALHPLRRQRFNELNVLRGISFEVQQGEFFGIVGRNGSGKSTLLKCLAGIYATDSGTIDVAGQLAPFIELGVGFNPDLPARDNIEINATMMGLNPRLVRERFDEIIQFGELEGFVDQKLKNYSSGMQVRLAFSIMVHSEPDIMLVDEVLAVGDAAFQQKCLDVFHRLKQEGKTIVLVTHAMSLVERFCDRAMMLSAGEIKLAGEPHEVGRAYLTENFASGYTDFDAHAEDPGDPVRVHGVWISDVEGRRADAVGYGERFTLHMEVEARQLIEQPGMAMWVVDEDGARVFTVMARTGPPLPDLQPGERVEFRATGTNPLTAGRYHVGANVVRGSSGLDLLYHNDRACDLVSYGADLVGLVAFPCERELVPARSPSAVAS